MTLPSAPGWVLLLVVLLLVLVTAVAVGMLAASARRQRRAQADLEAELARTRAESSAELARLRGEVAALSTRADDVRSTEQEPSASARSERPDQPGYVITRLGEGRVEKEGPPRIESRLFADVVLRESVVRVGSVALGLRRALDPATRNRVRFEMGREVKRSRKARRAEVRQARREFAAARARAAQGIGEGRGPGARGDETRGVA